MFFVKMAEKDKNPSVNSVYRGIYTVLSLQIFQCRLCGHLLGAFLAAAAADTDHTAIETDLHFKTLVVVRAGFANQCIGEDLIFLLLYQLLQCGFIVSIVHLFDRHFHQNKLFDDALGCLHAAIQETCGNHGFHRISQNGITVAAAALFLAVAQHQMLAQFNPRCHRCQRLFADHGCDPAYTVTTDHTREYVPLLMLGKRVKPVNLGTRSSFADIAATVAELLDVKLDTSGESFAKEILK